MEQPGSPGADQMQHHSASTLTVSWGKKNGTEEAKTVCLGRLLLLQDTDNVLAEWLRSAAM